MKIQLLTFPGCPNADAARAALREAIRRAGTDSVIEEIDLTAPATPPELRGWASPTILVDGVDVEGQTAPDGGGCRLYPGHTPSVDLIERRLRGATLGPVGPLASERTLATTDGSKRARRLAGGGALLAALAASACCLGPVLLAAIGLSGVGLAAALEPWRPVFLGVTAVLIAVGLYVAFRKRASDACDCPVPRARRTGRWMIVVVASLALGVAAYPWIVGGPAHATGVVDRGRATATAAIEIDGITCAACAKAIVRRLATVPGVADSRIDGDVATIHYDPSATTAAALAAVISEMPEYDVRRVTPANPKTGD